MSEYFICGDCAMWHANADVTALEDEARIAEVTKVESHFIVDCGDEAEYCTAFSANACDACGTHLAGERHRAFV